MTALGRRHIPILTLARMVWRKAKKLVDFKGTNALLLLAQAYVPPSTAIYRIFLLGMKGNSYFRKYIYWDYFGPLWRNNRESVNSPILHSTQFGAHDTNFSDYPLIGVLQSQGPWRCFPIYCLLQLTTFWWQYILNGNNSFLICPMRTRRKHDHLIFLYLWL